MHLFLNLAAALVLPLGALSPDDADDMIQYIDGLHDRGLHDMVASEALDFLDDFPNHGERERLSLALGRIEDDRGAGGLNILARMRSLLGVALLLLIAWIWSSDRKAIRFRLVFWGLGLPRRLAGWSRAENLFTGQTVEIKEGSWEDLKLTLDYRQPPAGIGTTRVFQALDLDLPPGEGALLKLIPAEDKAR